MHHLYVFSVWLHIMAATAWLGGMVFLSVVMVPYLRKANKDVAATFFAVSGTRLRNLGWVCFITLLGTGAFNLYMRGVRWSHLWSRDFYDTPFGKTLLWKFVLFAAVLVVSAYHDFVHGPRAVDALAASPDSPHAVKLRRQASLFGRINGLLAIVLVFLGVCLVRGCPG